jgi:hypothetical protein
MLYRFPGLLLSCYPTISGDHFMTYHRAQSFLCNVGGPATPHSLFDGEQLFQVGLAVVQDHPEVILPANSEVTILTDYDPHWWNSVNLVLECDCKPRDTACVSNIIHIVLESPCKASVGAQAQAWAQAMQGLSSNSTASTI